MGLFTLLLYFRPKLIPLTSTNPLFGKSLSYFSLAYLSKNFLDLNGLRGPLKIDAPSVLPELLSTEVLMPPLLFPI
ncbi:hypothetical protein Scep_021794 [Stephania cephalantha]|uniref:Uncharacterized protein n=1 Tax=Stephania cephalantha TaxID=152367 RepID=A0AAP0F439_9MAGN